MVLAMLFIAVHFLSDGTEVKSNPIDYSLVAHYTFDDNLVDSSGNGLDGTQLGNPSFVNGITGKAINFGGK